MPRLVRGDGTAFETWLRRDLREAYDSVMREDLPDELARLLASVPERGRDA